VRPPSRPCWPWPLKTVSTCSDLFPRRQLGKAAVHATSRGISLDVL
jgi:hypothetical protein